MADCYILNGASSQPVAANRTGSVREAMTSADLTPDGRAAFQTELAIDRTMLAVERTYDAWVRTGLTALASGIGARALLTGLVPDWLDTSTAAMLVLFAAFCFVTGAVREASVRQALPQAGIARLPGWMPLFANGFLTLVALTAFVGIVVTR